jgi:predicted lipoprotein with Yx(FWY)xxD motif
MKKISLKFLILFGIFTLFSNSSFARDPAKIKDGVLVSTSNNMTLYVFDKDLEGSGKSECNDQCAINWPPFSLTEKEKSHGHGKFKVITRNDNTLQWTTKSGKPLYFYSKDLKPGDKLGDNLNNVWKIAK